MSREPKKQSKVPFSEKDAAALLQRYDARTVLTLLQELANYPHSKFDWNELAAKTSTGISDAREYQMLWRNLAYGHSFTENFDNDAQLMDDDSDLECEREALPRINKETAAEVSACVQVMITSFKLSESTPTSLVIQAPLTINVPACDSSTIANKESSQPSNLSTQETSIIFPVTVKRQTLPNVSSRAMEANSSVSGNTSIKKKRAAWSEEEDMQLRAAVQRWGEGNWANMVKREDFPIKRSTSQLSKRWSTLRKKDDGAN
ncbi:Telomeric repeat-binding factor 1 [Spatholobus suberectus]|nr:Telomeric repeat-binding factor 1 [Spatholobus suberectus]